jgi:hypothetical protein
MSQDRTLVRPCDSLPGEGGLTLHRPAALVTNESPSLPVEGSRPVATRTTEVTPGGSDRESRAGTAAEGLRSTFAPPDAEPHGTGWNRRGPQVTAEAVGKLFVHVAGGNRDHEGTGGDPRGAAAATCKIAGIAYTGSNPVPEDVPSGVELRWRPEGDQAASSLVGVTVVMVASSAARSAGRWRWPLTLRNCLRASPIPAAIQRSTIWPSCQRLTLAA